MLKIAIFPGTFDPITNGHVELVHRAISLFDKVIVAVAVSSRKSPFFPLEDRLKLCKEVFSDKNNVEVKSFDQLLVTFAKEQKSHYILRGIRGVSDFDYEFQMAAMNRQMAPDIETLFLPANHENAYISGSMIREILSLGGDASSFVPSEIIEYLKKKR